VDDANPDTERVGDRQLLDLALVDAHLGVGGPADVGLELLVAAGLGDDGVGDVEQVAHRLASGSPMSDRRFAASNALCS
jgi:hypothetical protein